MILSQLLLEEEEEEEADDDEEEGGDGWTGDGKVLLLDLIGGEEKEGRCKSIPYEYLLSIDNYQGEDTTYWDTLPVIGWDRFWGLACSPIRWW